MKKKVVILMAVLASLLIVIGLMTYLRGDEDSWICEEGVWVKHGSPSAPMPTEPCGLQDDVQQGTNETAEPVQREMQENAEPEMIGGQTDEHGCLIGAGYSWCEAKSKCLRIWEEECPENNN